MNLFRHYFGSLFRSLRWGAEAGVALAILSASTPAFADIAKPGDMIAGHTQLEWAQAWWQWAVGVPAPDNPLLDTTGANAGVNNNGPVFFVAGVAGSGTVVRTVTVPSGKPIFVPVVNGFYVPIGADGGFDPTPCPASLPFSCAIQTATGQFSPLHSMSLQIDGVALNLKELRSYRQASTSYFTASVPANNIFGVPGGPLLAILGSGRLLCDANEPFTGQASLGLSRSMGCGSPAECHRQDNCRPVRTHQ